MKKKVQNWDLYKVKFPCPFESADGVDTNYQDQAMLHMFLAFSVVSHVIRLWCVMLMVLAASGHLAHDDLCLVSLPCRLLVCPCFGARKEFFTWARTHSRRPCKFLPYRHPLRWSIMQIYLTWTKVRQPQRLTTACTGIGVKLEEVLPGAN